MINYIIELVKAKSQHGDWYWRIKSKNGKVLAHSEKYKSRTKAENTALKLAQSLKNTSYRVIV